MADENLGGTAAPDTSPSLASVVGEMFGDFRDAEPETDAGAPPATTPETPADSEGDATSVPAGAPPAEADGTTAPDASTLPSTDPDPLDGATPLDYVVDGQARSFDGITVLKSGGAIIDPDALAKVQRVFGERDHLFEASKAQYDRVSTLEKLTEWKTTGPDGKEQLLTGAPAIEASRLAYGSALAKLQAYESVLSDPSKLAALLTYDETTGVFGLNQPALETLTTRIENAQLKVAQFVRSYVGTMAAPAAPTSAPPFDAHASATQIVDYAIKSAAVTGLTEADKTWAATIAPRYVHAATVEEVRANPTLRVGEPVLEPAFVDLLTDRAQLRAESAKQVSTASDVAKQNAAKIAAAKVGSKGQPNAPRITPTPPSEPSRDQDFDSLWDRQEKAAAGALRSHAVGR